MGAVRSGRDEVVDVGPGRAVEALDGVRGQRRDQQVAIVGELEPDRCCQPAGSGGHERVHVQAGAQVEAHDRVAGRTAGIEKTVGSDGHTTGAAECSVGEHLLQVAGVAVELTHR